MIKARNKGNKIVFRGIHIKSTHIMNQRCVALPLGVKLLLNPYFIPATQPRTVCTFFHTTFKRSPFSSEAAWA